MYEKFDERLEKKCFILNKINEQKLAEIFADTMHHKTVAGIVRRHSTNKLDVRNVALDGLQLQKSKTILDIGCGFGFFTLALKGRLNPDSDIRGIDVCTNYKTPYLESCNKAGLQGKFIELEKNTINRIPDNSVDLVICSYALYFFPTLIPEISRILKPSGAFVIITHSENHLTEIIAFLKETLDILGIQKTGSLPCQDLINNFSDSNGYKLLSPWFGRVEEKEYRNTLHFRTSDFEDLENYFRFKQLHYIPDNLENKSIVFGKMISRLREYFQLGNSFSIAKDDTIFICNQPLYGN